MTVASTNSTVLSELNSAGLVIRALRLHYWLKNILLFVPVVLATAVSSDTLSILLIGWLAFGCAASAHYLVNDFLDKDLDELEFAKRWRPQVAGELPPGLAAGLALALIGAAAICGSWLPAGFQMALASYLVLCLVYSLLLKRFFIIDVLALVVLHDLRLVAGAAAASIPLSNSVLLGFSCFFLAIGLFKRIAQLASTTVDVPGPLPGRAYSNGDRPTLRLVAAAAGAASVLVLANFLHNLGTQVPRPGALWLIPAILAAWLGRCLFMAGRQKLNEDLVFFCVTDRYSMITLAGLILLFIVAQ